MTARMPSHALGTPVYWPRVFGGGLIAALVLAVLWLPVIVVFREDGLALLTALGLSTKISALMVAYGAVVTPGLGIFVIWLYALLQTRFGPGPRTAVTAGFAVWLLTLLVDGGWPALGIVPLQLFALLKAADLPAFLLAAVIGARFYREDARQARPNYGL